MLVVQFQYDLIIIIMVIKFTQSSSIGLINLHVHIKQRKVGGRAGVLESPPWGFKTDLDKNLRSMNSYYQGIFMYKI